MAAEEEPFFAQFYGEAGCRHQKIAVDDNYCGSCLGDCEPTKDGFSVQYVRFGFIATVSLIDNGLWN